MALLFTSGILALSVSFGAEESKGSAIQDYELSPFEVGAIVQLPEAIEPEIPVFPRLRGDTEIAINFTVNEQGFPSKVTTDPPVFALGLVEEEERDFGLLMRSLVSSWKFSPAVDSNGNPVKVKVTMPIKFTRKDGTPAAELSLILDIRGQDR